MYLYIYLSGWELSYICCNTDCSCHTSRYTIMEAKAHFLEEHPDVEFELDDEDVLGVSDPAGEDYKAS